MKAKYAEIMFCQEAPRIGCGRRIVQIVKVGRLWAYVKVPTTGIRQRIPVCIFNRLQQRPVKLRRKYRKPYAEARPC